MNPSRTIQLTTSDDDANMRLDSFLVSRIPEFSRAKLQRAIGKGDVLVDDTPAKASFKISPGQTITVRLPEPESTRAVPEAIDLDILYQNDQIIAINKPPGMVVHPAKGHWSGTLTSALAYHFQQLSTAGGLNRPGIVHRLDRDTSGVILVRHTIFFPANLNGGPSRKNIGPSYPLHRIEIGTTSNNRSEPILTNGRKWPFATATKPAAPP